MTGWSIHTYVLYIDIHAHNYPPVLYPLSIYSFELFIFVYKLFLYTCSHYVQFYLFLFSFVCSCLSYIFVQSVLCVSKTCVHVDHRVTFVKRLTVR